MSCILLIWQSMHIISDGSKPWPTENVPYTDELITIAVDWSFSFCLNSPEEGTDDDDDEDDDNATVSVEGCCCHGWARPVGRLPQCRRIPGRTTPTYADVLETITWKRIDRTKHVEILVIADMSCLYHFLVVNRRSTGILAPFVFCRPDAILWLSFISTSGISVCTFPNEATGRQERNLVPVACYP